MTTPPKAKKFRIRRSTPLSSDARPQAGEERAPLRAVAGAAPQGQAKPQPPREPRTLNPLEQSVLDGNEDGFPEEGFGTAGRAAPQPGAQPGAQGGAQGGGQAAQPGAAQPGAHAHGSPEAEIAAIRQEGLTGRQLRMARRVAQKHGLPATSEYDAVRLLRRAGIDPFARANMLELMGSDDDVPAKKDEDPKLPKVVPKGGVQLPSTQVLDATERARAVMDIQKDIAKRRRRKLVLLATRLAFFVMLPTLIAGYYYYVIATPMYATKSEFVIQKADAGGAPGLATLFAGSGLATSQDSITVQSYLTSRDAMLRLDSDLGFKAHFEDPNIDPIQRLEPNASNEAAYKLYKRNVKIGFDPSEGIVKMEVIAASPELSAAFSEALIRYAEERVDQLTQRLREDQMSGARESYDKAESEMLAAQAEVERLQNEMGVFDATADASAVMGQVNTFEIELQKKKLELQQLLDNTRPNQARVDGVRGDIGRLENLIKDLRAKLTERGTPGSDSLAQISGQLTIAKTNLETRTLLMQQALQQLETARIEANKQTRYLSLGVHPVAPDRPTYPRAFENTLLAFLVFAGIYLMLSVTASILREQVSG